MNYEDLSVGKAVARPITYWAVVGEANSRKSATIRALSGAKSRIREWEVLIGGAARLAYIEMDSPQEQNPPLTPAQVVANVHASINVTHVLIALRHKARRGRAAIPRGFDYMQHFDSVGWQCAGVLLNSLEPAPAPIATHYGSLVDVAPSQTRPFAASNAIAAGVRARWRL